MGLFSSKSEGGMLDVIRCDEEDYIIWKWSPSGAAGSSRKENAIRWGSSLRVKDGEVAVFVYKQEGGPTQDFIEGPYDETLKTANFPILSNIMGLAFDGKSPFQAEVYFINLAGNVKLNFRVPYFDVADPRFPDHPVRVSTAGSFMFNITNYKAFIKLHRLINFDMQQFAESVRDAVFKYVKAVVVNAPIDHGIPVLQIERKLLEINDLILPRIRSAFEDDFGVNLKRLDISTIEIDKETEEYRELRSISADLEAATRIKQAEINVRNLDDTQRINALNMEETLAIQRAQANRFAELQTQSQFLGAHQINQQTQVLTAAAENLGQMGQMNLGGGVGGGGGGGFNPIGVMTGLAVGGAMGGQMANMMNATAQNMPTPGMTPPPMPTIAYFVSVNGQNTGPFNLQQLQAMVASGQLTRSTYVWKQGMAGWEHAEKQPDLASLFAAPPDMPPPPPMDMPPPPPAG